MQVLIEENSNPTNSFNEFNVVQRIELLIATASC
jgi:hypothetical protein